MSKKSEKKTGRFGIKIGVASGIISLLCCVSPIFLVLLGLSSITGAIALGNFMFDNYKTYFISASILFFVGATIFKLKRKNQCSVSGIRKNQNMIITSAIIFVITYIFLYYFTTMLGMLGEKFVNNTL